VSVALPTLYVLLGLVLVVIPAYGAGSVVAEQEKRTLDLLRTTLLSPTDVLWGKLLPVLAYAVVMLLTALPVLCWTLLLGGLSPSSIFYVLSYLLALAVMVGCTGLAVSVFAQRLAAAVAVTYAILALTLLVGPLLLLLRHEQSGSQSMQMGTGGAIFFVLALAGIVAALVFISLRSLLQRLSLRADERLLAVAPAALALTLGALLIRLTAAPVAALLSSTALPGILLLHPFAALAALVNDMSMLSPGGLRAGLPQGATQGATQGWLWFLVTALALVWATLAWHVARYGYQTRLR
jgi:ABC-type transport system involved in multi-copper enzyme maturation permease subunit